LTCQATAYDLSFESCGKYPGEPGYGITASGTYAKVGTVAVDPRVIPLGTKMYIVSTDGSYVYGYCTAEDTGGGIKGNKVDLFYNTRNECMQFGRRSVRVYILN
jgi:3D (Asp-Asp-Asp) domain-containing protein